jgi:glycosyltransferase involved in cell wall biosynthesis
VLERFGLEPRRYILYVSRFEPENNPDKVVRAFERVDTDFKLVMVGDAPYAPEFVRSVRATRDPRIVFTGYLYGPGYVELQSHAYAYIHATEVGGTHPALIEAMGLGNCVLVNATPENLEVAGDAALPLDIRRPDALAAGIRRVLARPDEADAYRRRAVRRIEQRYTWDRAAELTERLCRDLVAGQPRPGLHWLPDGDHAVPARPVRPLLPKPAVQTVQSEAGGTGNVERVEELRS